MKKKTVSVAVAILLGVGIVGVGSWITVRSFTAFEPSAVTGEEGALLLPGPYPIETLGLPTTPTVLTDARNYGDGPVEVACATCHSTRTPTQNRRTEDLDAFHQGLVLQHGDLSCLSCHNAKNYDTLQLADGTSIGFEQVMELCAQCHGPQSRDYRNGSHGGMNGYWDLSRGPRQRNACIVCHDAHAPAYPQLMPVFPPKDIIPPKHSPSTEH